MKVCMPIICAAVLTTVSAGLLKQLQTEPPRFYHQEVGIAAAERIRRAEETDGSSDAERIMGGSFAALGDYPYMGGLVITLTTGEISSCGSSLLSHTRLVTAAHCWWDGRHQALQFIVVLGSTRLFSGGVRVATNQVEMHHNWNFATLTNDIAMISIQHVTFADAISPVALPNGEESMHEFVGWWAIAVGYGMTGTLPSDAINQSLSHVGMWVMNHIDCRVWYPQAVSSTMCASGSSDRRGVCNGDSGGPFVYTDGIRPMLIGVTSFWSNNCAAVVAFTRITTYRFWIRQRI